MCVIVCMHVCVCMRVTVLMCALTRHTQARTLPTHARIRTNTRIRAYDKSTHAHKHTHTHTRTHLRTHTHTNARFHQFTHICARTHLLTHTASFPGSPSISEIIPRMTFDPPERKAEGEPGRFCHMTSVMLRQPYIRYI